MVRVFTTSLCSILLVTIEMTPKCSTLKCIQESKPGGFTAKFEYYTLSRLFYDREGIENRNCCRLVQLNEIDSFRCLPSLSFSRGKSDIEIIFFSRRSPRDIRHFHCRRALRVLISEALRPRFDHFTANNKLRFAVNGFTLPVCPYLGLKIC